MAPTRKDLRHAEILRQQWALHEERLKRERLSCDVISCASNAKWRKVFDELSSKFRESGFVETKTSRVKLLRDDEPFEFPRIVSSHFEGDYLEGHYGVVGFQEIEWIEIEAGGFTAGFDCQVESEVVGHMLRIYGYRRSERK